ncbi:hypothetical protein D1224_12500 [Henriciella barbarensis]|uniref:Uncharacterized protein n=1 Tax=Henriciella barbarensis TaxID=86342 RepID=A0A399QS42_9PROT|nr:hypothetical protein D1224_12500 [Henriciella barbarensis]
MPPPISSDGRDIFVNINDNEPPMTRNRESNMTADVVRQVCAPPQINRNIVQEDRPEPDRQKAECAKDEGAVHVDDWTTVWPLSDEFILSMKSVRKEGRVSATLGMDA